MQRLSTIKIFIAGLPDSGKTTFVKTSSEITPLSTDVKVSDRETTIAFDFGLITLKTGHRIYVYGLPGQERFSFMWEIINKGAMGYIYLIPAGGYDIPKIVSHFSMTRKITSLPFIVGFTKLDLYRDASDLIQQIKTTIELNDDEIITLDPRKVIDVKSAIEKLFEKILRNYEEKYLIERY